MANLDIDRPLAKSQSRVSQKVSNEPLKKSLKSPQRTPEIIASGATALVVLVINCCFRLQAGDGERGAAADQDAGQQVQRSRHGEHQEHEGDRRQGEAGLHRREGHLQDELIEIIYLKTV